MSVLFLLAALAGTPSPLPPADSADGRCIVLLGFVGAHGTPEQAAASRQMIPFFLGKLLGRDPRAAIGPLVVQAADEAKARGVSARADGARCEAEYRAGTAALTGVGQAAGIAPPR